MKIYLYKQNGNVAKERNTSDYFVIRAIYESHTDSFTTQHIVFVVPSSMIISHFWLLPGSIPFVSLWHNELIL